MSERFFTGGDSSVRSFEEQQLGPKGATGDPLGGLASTVAGVELRRRIAGNLAANVFADFGNVAPNRSLEGTDPTERARRISSTRCGRTTCRTSGPGSASASST